MQISSVLPGYFSIKTLVWSLRVFNTRPIILFYLLGVSFSRAPSIQEILIVWITFIFSYASASLLNYDTDYKSDKINNNFNPLSHFPSSTILFLALVSAAGSLLIAFRYDYYLFVTIGLHIICGILYSSPWFKASYFPVPKFFLMVMSYCILPVLAGVKWKFPDYESALFAISVIFQYGSWLLYSDIKDIKGDLKVGKITIAAYLGVTRTAIVSAILSSVCSAIISVSVIALKLDVSISIISWLLVFFQTLGTLYPSLLKQRGLQKIMGWYLLGSLLFIVYFLYTAR